MPLIDYGGRRVVFVHVPKAAGTSVEEWMGGLAPLHFRSRGIPACSKVTPQHYTWSDLINFVPPETVDYAFVILRNPFERMASAYKMRWLMAQDGHLGEIAPFSSWLETATERYKTNPHAYDNHLRPQWMFLGQAVRRFRLEDGLKTILDRVAAESGLPAPEAVPRCLATDAFPGEVEWDTADIGRMREVYQGDFAELGYSSDPP